MSKNINVDELLKAYSLKVGVHKGNKRVWIDSRKILDSNLGNDMSFTPVYDLENKTITLVKGRTNSITVSKRYKRAVIDINNRIVSKIFKGYTQMSVRLYNDEIIIEPLKEEILQKKAAAKSCSKIPSFIEIFAGGGSLVRSLVDAKLKPVAAIEIEEKYLENLELNNPGLTTYCGDLAKLDLSLLPDADIVSLGLPCEIFSKSSFKKLDSHPTGSLGFYALKIIEHIRPAVVLLEETATFKNSAMASLMKFVLSSMGYFITEEVLSATDYGSLTSRQRYCMVASIKEKFEFKKISKRNTRTIADILEVPMDQRVWLDKNNSDSIAYSLEKEKKHIEKGDGFRICRKTIDETSVQTITKGYYRNQLTNPVIIRSLGEDVFSWFTPTELKRINGFPEDFIIPDVKTTSGEVIGQGVCYEMFNQIGKDIYEHFQTEPKDEEILEEKSLVSKLIKSTEESNNSTYSSEQLEIFSQGNLF